MSAPYARLLETPKRKVIMEIKWDTLCGRQSIQTDTDTIKMFGGAVCCWNCYAIYVARMSWHNAMGHAYP